MGQKIVVNAPILFILTFFTRLLTIQIPFLGGYDLYAYTVLLILFFFSLKSTRLLINSSIVFGLLFTASFLAKLIGGYSISLLLKQIIPIFIIYTATIYIVRKYSITYLFEIYGKIVVVIATFGIAQVLLSFFGLYILSEPRFSIQAFGVSFRRLNSILTEPSHYAVVTLPYLVFLLVNTKKRILSLYLVGLSICLTLSLTAFAAILITLGMHYIGKINAATFFGILAVLVVGYTLYLNIEPVKYRVDETIKYYSTKKFEDKTNATTFSLVTNVEVALYALKENFLLGSGLGGHEEVYEEYFKTVDTSNFKELFNRRYGLNKQSGHSLLIRLISETGILGLFALIYAVFKLKVHKNRSIYYSINIACVSYFIARCFKLGGYFDFGIYFFVILYYYSYINNKNNENNSYNRP